MVYETLLTIGGVGLTALTVLGFGKGHDAGSGQGGHGHNGNHGAVHDHATPGHSPSGHTSVSAASQTGGAHPVTGQTASNALQDPEFGHLSSSLTRGIALRGRATGRGIGHRGRVASLVFELISPLTLFSLSLGAGAVGFLLRLHTSEPITALAAATGGLAFHFGLIKPLTGLLLQFASRPAKTLTGAVAQEGIALTRFDAQGCGMVQIIVDGQIVSLLARLDKQDSQNNVTVGKGDRLLVTHVDGKRNQVHVTKASF